MLKGGSFVFLLVCHSVCLREGCPGGLAPKCVQMVDSAGGFFIWPDRMGPLPGLERVICLDHLSWVSWGSEIKDGVGVLTYRVYPGLGGTYK